MSRDETPVISKKPMEPPKADALEANLNRDQSLDAVSEAADDSDPQASLETAMDHTVDACKSDFKCHVEWKCAGETVVFILKGQLDEPHVGKMRHAFRQASEQHPLHAIIDVGQLEFVGKAGLRAWLEFAQMFPSPRGNLAVVRANEWLRNVMGVTGFSEIFTLYETQAQALDIFQRHLLTKPTHGVYA